MRILHVTQSYYPYLERGGIPVLVQAFAEYLASNGHQVTVLTANYGHPFTTKIDQVAGVDVTYLGYVARYRGVTLSPQVFSFCKAKLKSFDIVHTYGLYNMLVPSVAWWCRKLGVKYVAEPAGMYRPITRSIYKKQLHRFLVGESTVKGATRVIAASKQERNELVEEGLEPEQIVLRRYGIDLSEFEVLPPRGRFRKKLNRVDDKPLIVFLSRISSKKRPDMLVQAFANLNLSAYLAIIGPDDGDGCIQTMQQIIDTYNLQDRVFLPGPQYGSAKVEALVDADLFVLPSENESFGIAIAEAIACNTPVIITDRCGISPFVKDRVGLVVPGNLDALQEALKHLMTDAALRKEFEQNTPMVAQELSWLEPAKETESLYERLMNNASMATPPQR